MNVRSRTAPPVFVSLAIKSALQEMGDSFFGPSSSIFVGRQGYPDVFVGPLASMEYSSAQDNPGQWFGKGYYDIIKLRSSLLRSKYRHSVHAPSKFLEYNQELALASSPTDVELGFRNKPGYRMTISSYVQPMGPSVTIESMRLAQNPKISRKVDSIVSDDLKAADASFLLYKSGVDVYKLTNILSSGILGISKKMVPTRWSITASDDIIAKHLMKEIRLFPEIEECLVYESEYMDNHFVILLMPGTWEFENFEAWHPGSNWSFSDAVEIAAEYEPFSGRKDYASTEAGGYYASRIGVTEAVHAMKKQCKAVVFREIGGGYTVPIGVWLVRETIRNAFNSIAKRFASKTEALEYIKARIRLPLAEYLKRSVILRQKSVKDFI
ncbi:MAG: hypothetical protein HY364_03890 [Candidatus Aenigmarchaeota archaeon]|nr:hypothetical protein [Candidatus Aenigmarchaeota archaeon]